jgi:hypothetical protein
MFSLNHRKLNVHKQNTSYLVDSKMPSVVRSILDLVTGFQGGKTAIECKTKFLFHFNPSRTEFLLIRYKNSVRTSWETYVTAIESNRLKLYIEFRF